ncbi:MAG: flagellar hook-associated protein FlgL [candidate division Zixibacteria bacterium]|nr:flagellar hook-associated protein FlgL [candidate division Zixibacteria bacterium]
MRVTNGMITDRVIFNLQRSITRFYQLQTDMSSGRRINKPSDDPTGALRDLNYRTELSKITQYRSNVSQGLNWTSTYDTILNDTANFVSTAKEIAVSMSNGTYDESARMASASEVRSLFEQMVQMGNNQLEGRYIFSGYRTKVKPLTVTPNGVIYNGDQGKMEFEIESSLRMQVNLDGSETFFKQLAVPGEKADLNVKLSGDTLLTDLNGGSGVDMNAGSFTVTDKNLNISVTVDLNAAPPVTTIGELLNRINTTLAAGAPPITNLTAQLGDEGNNIVLRSVPNGLISVDTHLDRLNDGNGVDLVPGKIMVSDGAAINVEIDLSTANNVGDVITAFNSQLTAAGVNNVTMAINPAGTGFIINDTNGVPLGLTISNISGAEQTASHLGITGYVGATLIGGDLNPEMSFEIQETTGTTATDLGLLGSFNRTRTGDDIDPQLVATSLLSALNNGTGLGNDRIVFWQGDSRFILDLGSAALNTVQDLLDSVNTSGLNITASINEAGTGIQIVNNDPNRTLTIEDVDGGRGAKTMGIFGSSDIFGTMIVLINCLENDDQEGTGLLLGSLDNSIQHLLKYRGVVGARSIRLETTDSRLVDMNLNFTKLLSEVEDADMTKLVSDLATYENNYQASLIASSKIIQPSLLNFLK